MSDRTLHEQMLSRHFKQMRRIERQDEHQRRQIAEAEELENAMKRWQARNRENLQNLQAND